MEVEVPIPILSDFGPLKTKFIIVFIYGIYTIHVPNFITLGVTVSEKRTLQTDGQTDRQTDRQTDMAQSNLLELVIISVYITYSLRPFLQGVTYIRVNYNVPF